VSGDGARSVSVGQLHARLEPVQRAAVRTSGLTLMGHVQVDARMLAPQRHLGIGAEDRQVGGVQLDGRVLGGRLAHGGTETEDGSTKGTKGKGPLGWPHRSGHLLHVACPHGGVRACQGAKRPTVWLATPCMAGRGAFLMLRRPAMEGAAFFGGWLRHSPAAASDGRPDPCL